MSVDTFLYIYVDAFTDNKENHMKLNHEHIKAQILAVQFHVFPGTTMTVCCLTLSNGFNVTGESACVDPAEFDREIGAKLAYDDAERKVWQLEGYLLKDFLASNKGQSFTRGPAHANFSAAPSTARTERVYADTSIKNPKHPYHDPVLAAGSMVGLLPQDAGVPVDTSIETSEREAREPISHGGGDFGGGGASGTYSAD